MKEYGLYNNGGILWELLVDDRAWAFVGLEDALKKMQELGCV